MLGFCLFILRIRVKLICGIALQLSFPFVFNAKTERA